MAPAAGRGLFHTGSGRMAGGRASCCRNSNAVDAVAGPVWSADSRYIAFFADGKLKKVAVTGAPPSVICSEPGRDASWSSENVILDEVGRVVDNHGGRRSRLIGVRRRVPG